MIFLVDITQIISNIGIPGGIAVYLVWWITNKLNSKLDRLIIELSRLNNNLERLRCKSEKG